MKNSPGKAALITSLLLLLFFPNLLVLLGYTVNESIFLGIVAGISGGLIAGWSNMEEETKLPANTDSNFINLEEKPEEKAEKSSETEKSEAANNTNFQPSETIINKDLTSAETAENAPMATYLPKENIQNNDRGIKNIDYELKFIETSPEDKTEVANKSSKKNPANSQKSASKIQASTRPQRKKVSLFSWLLMKKGESSKTRGR